MAPRSPHDFLTVSGKCSPWRPASTGKCLRAELDWARTKFALVVLTEMKSIDLTPLLNTYGPPSDERPPSSYELADELADEL